jgi:Tol biopolymer transport system component
VKRLALLALLLVLLVAGSASGATPQVSYWDPAWSPDGAKIAYVERGDVPGDLYVMNADGSNVRKLTSSAYPGPNYGAREPSWSPDGKTIAFAYGEYGIATVGDDGTSLRKISRSGDQPAWSPGGRKIAFSDGDESSGNSIYVMRPDGSHRQLVAKPDAEHSYNGASWSRDGQRIAFSVGSAPDVGARTTWLGVVSQLRGRVARYAVGSWPSSPDWSRDGRRIVFASGYGNAPSLAILTLRTRGVRLLPVKGFRPHWSPDGKRIVYTDSSAIFVVDADGSHVVRLTH